MKSESIVFEKIFMLYVCEMEILSKMNISTKVWENGKIDVLIEIYGS